MSFFRLGGRGGKGDPSEENPGCLGGFPSKEKMLNGSAGER
jgi:hypothetical protein